MRISAIAQTYTSEFPSDWIEGLDWSTDEKSKESYESGRNKIEDFITKSFRTFCTSALSGEYVVVDLDSSLSDFRSILIREYPPVIDNKFQDALYASFQELETDLLLVVNRYRSLIQLVVNKISRDNHDYILSAFVSKKHQCSHDTLEDVVNYCFPLCQTDHFLKYTNDENRSLLLIREDLKQRIEAANDERRVVYKALNEKCVFLLKKLMHIRGGAEYQLNFETIPLEAGSIEIDFLRKFDKHFSFLHIQEYHRPDSDIDTWRQNCQNREAPFTEFILLMRYLVRNGGQKQQVDSLIEDFNACIEMFNVEQDFDRYAIGSLKNYMLNSYFSYLLSRRHVKYSEFKERLSEISGLQQQTQVYNFHPYEKAIEYLLIDINDDINNSVDKNIVEEKIQQLEECYEKFKDNIKWCQRQDYYPFQLPYRECLHEIEDGITLFIPSSFTKPLNYLQICEKYSECAAEVSAIKEQLRIWDDKQEILELKEQLAGHQKKYIQILGLFTAILTFLFGTVDIFSAESTKTLQDKINDTAVLGLLLMIFSCSIYLLSLGRKDKIWTFRNILFALMIVGYFILLLRFYS